MSWFGGGGGSKNDSNSGSSYQPESSYQDQGFVGQQESYAAPRSGGGTSTESFQQELIMEQQKALIQAVMFKLTETAFQKCVTSPSTSLSSSKISQNL
jgi:Tim10/DDP family zinc finger